VIKSRFNRFLKSLVIFTGVLSSFIFAVCFFLLPQSYITPALPYLIVFFFLVTLVIHYILLVASEKRTSKFVNYFMLTTFLKLVFYIIIMVVYGLLNKSDAIPFFITYFILYVAFTTFELISFFNLTKRTQEKNMK